MEHEIDRSVGQPIRQSEGLAVFKIGESVALTTVYAQLVVRSTEL